jgi:hypothetical protein
VKKDPANSVSQQVRDAKADQSTIESSETRHSYHKGKYDASNWAEKSVTEVKRNRVAKANSSLVYV